MNVLHPAAAPHLQGDERFTDAPGTVLFTLGTPHGSWSTLATALLDAMATRLRASELADWLDALSPAPAAAAALPALPQLPAGEPWGVLDGRLLWAVDVLASAIPHACFLVFVDSPTRALAHLIADSNDPDLPVSLELWIRGSRHLLRQAHRHPGQILLVDTEEAAASPQALGELVSRRTGLAVGPWEAPPPVDALAVAAAAAIVTPNRAANALHAELYASCLPLSHHVDATPPAMRTTGLEAAGSYGRLRAAAIERDRLTAVQAALQSKLAERDARLTSLATERRQLERTCDQLQVGRQAVERDRDQLMERFQHTQQELESLVATCTHIEAQRTAAAQRLASLQSQLQEAQDARRAADTAETTARAALDEAQGRARQLESRLLEVQAAERAAQVAAGRLETLVRERELELSDMRSRLDDADAQRHAVAKQLSDVESRLRDALDREGVAQASARRLEARVHELEEQDVLTLQQLHQVQEELEHHFLELKRRDEAPPEPAAAGLRIGAEANKAPHRHLDVILTPTPEAGLGADAPLRLRLVQHHGRPGLALFAPPDAPPPLGAWQPSGQESGTPFMLVVPSDPAGRAALERLGTGDWQTFTHLVDLLERQLAESNEPAAKRWADVARHLAVHVADLAPRLRYDAAVARTTDEGQLEVMLQEPSFGDRRLATIRLQWEGRSQTPLVWLRSSEDTVPDLACWPVDADGRLEPRWTVPVGAALSAADKRRQWGQLSARDQALVTSVLDALPDAVARAPAPPSGRHVGDLREQARALRQEAGRHLRAARVRTLIRRALGRLH
jgi:hypothetical protein